MFDDDVDDDDDEEDDEYDITDEKFNNEYGRYLIVCQC